MYNINLNYRNRFSEGWQLAPFVALVLTPVWLGLLFYRFFLETKGLNALWDDNFDSRLVLWIFERNYLSLTNLPFSEFWNANQFYPTEGSLAFSDSIIAGQIVYLPMRLMGYTPLESLYLTFFVIIFISTYLIVSIGHKILQLTVMEWIIFCFICQFSLTATNFLGHYQLFAFQLAPAFFLMLYSMLLLPTGKKLIGLTLLFITISSFATYFAPMSVSIVIIILTILVLFNRGKLLNIILSYSNYKVSIIISAILLGLFFYVQLLPYVKILGELPPQNMAETKVYSAKLMSLINAPSPKSEIYKANIVNGYWEYSYFPGFVILFGSLIGIIFLIQIGEKDKKLLLIFLLILSSSALILSYGPYFKSSLFGQEFIVPLPFYILAKILPGFENIRAPGRFGAFLTLPLAFFFISAVKEIKIVRVRFLCVPIIFALIIYDSRVTARLYSFDATISPFYQKVKQVVNYREPTLILPLHKDSHLNTILNYMDQLHISNQTGLWVVAGYGAKSTHALHFYTDLSRQVAEKKIPAEQLFCQAKKDGIRNVITSPNFLMLSDQASEICNYELVINESNYMLYRLTINTTNN